MQFPALVPGRMRDPSNVQCSFCLPAGLVSLFKQECVRCGLPLTRATAASIHAFLQATPAERMAMLTRLDEQFGETPEPTTGKNGKRTMRSYLLPGKLRGLFDEQARRYGYIRHHVVGAMVLHFLQSDADDRARMLDNLERFLNE
jgi:hypothetical protein